MQAEENGEPNPSAKKPNPKVNLLDHGGRCLLRALLARRRELLAVGLRNTQSGTASTL
jgi:hypothetical protein